MSFFKKIIYQDSEEIERLQKQLNELSDRVYRLEFPPKFSVKDFVKWGTPSNGWPLAGTGQIVRVEHSQYSRRWVYQVWSGERLYTMDENDLKINDKP